MAGNVRLHSTNSRKFCPHQIPETVIREGMELYKCPISRNDQLFSRIIIPENLSRLRKDMSPA